MDSIGDLLSKKADDIDMEAKKDDLELSQIVISRHFKSGVKAVSINNETLSVRVTSSPLASEVRLSQVKLLAELNRSLKTNILRISIRH